MSTRKKCGIDLQHFGFIAEERASNREAGLKAAILPEQVKNSFQ
ncbi:hypothetical protein PAMC26510_34985 [Caballeronia sordidicola]|uniref:Uncharacterized protein n=1 Tax=Caballeronia sordidicola TaxID=196367 RepID=A0A242M5S4_CABSO|nr:hypothetical protein PAMC26510_34985 [Caballeronia sordidicola]